MKCGLGIVVGITAGYRLDGLRIPVGVRFSASVQTGLGPTQPPVQWVPVLYRGKERPGHDADPSPPSSAEVKKKWSYAYLYFPYGPYGLYRALVPVQGCTLPCYFYLR